MTIILALQQEREAMKKLENVRKDHNQRLVGLEKAQEEDKLKAELITRNQELVDRTILSVQMLLGQQVPLNNINYVSIVIISTLFFLSYRCLGTILKR